MGGTITSDPDPFRPEDPKNCCKTPQNPTDPDPFGMPTYSIHSMLVSLNVQDTPLFYDPPRGPAMRFTVTYNQRENDRSANPSYTNFGPKWTFNWFSFIEDHPLDSPDREVRHFVRDGGWRTYSGYDSVTGDFETDDQTQARLVRDLTVSAPAVRYIRYMNDGSQEIFSYTDGGTLPRRIFMTAYKDPTGNTVTMEYEYVASSAQTRLKRIIDAVSQATTIQYDGNTGRVSRITDPFGRYAEFGVGSGPFGSITDVIGVTSTLQYASGTDRMIGITTPYLSTGPRQTTFEHYCEDETPSTACTKPNRWITVTDSKDRKSVV